MELCIVLDYHISEAWNQILCDIDCPSKQIQKILWADMVNMESRYIPILFSTQSLKKVSGQTQGGPVVDRVDT